MIRLVWNAFRVSRHAFVHDGTAPGSPSSRRRHQTTTTGVTE
jgi:hypothetical protein